MPLGSGAGSSAIEGDFFEVAEVMGYFKSETHFTLAAGRRGFIAPKRQTDGAGSQMYQGGAAMENICAGAAQRPMVARELSRMLEGFGREAEGR